MKPLTKLELLWQKDPLKVEDAATLLSGGDRHAHSAAEGLLATAIETRKLRANVVRWPVYISDLGTEIDDGSGNINQHETTIRMEDFKVYCQSIGAVAGKEAVTVEQAKSPAFDKTSLTYPLELDIALQAWKAVSTNEGKGKPKARIKAWLDADEIAKKLSDEAKERIAIVANWDKTGGATRTE